MNMPKRSIRVQRKKPSFKEQIAAAQAVQAAEDQALADELIGEFEPSKPSVSSRPAMRESMREEDPRARAARRAQELRDHGSVFEESNDKFFVDASIIPAGWAYEWKRHLVAGAQDPTYEVTLARTGWEPVAASRHPEMMPQGWTSFIEREGMILMERPLEINDEAKARDLRTARNQVRQKEDQLYATETGQFERNNKDQTLVKIGRSYEHIPIPKD